MKAFKSVLVQCPFCYSIFETWVLLALVMKTHVIADEITNNKLFFTGFPRKKPVNKRVEFFLFFFFLGPSVQGSHFLRRTFLSKISIHIYSCESLVCQLDSKGHTLYVALFGAKFLLLYGCVSLVCQLDPKGHTFYVALF